MEAGRKKETFGRAFRRGQETRAERSESGDPRRAQGVRRPAPSAEKSTAATALRYPAQDGRGNGAGPFGLFGSIRYRTMHVEAHAEVLV
jgi:hypothetical protein